MEARHQPYDPWRHDADMQKLERQYMAMQARRDERRSTQDEPVWLGGVQPTWDELERQLAAL